MNIKKAQTIVMKVVGKHTHTDDSMNMENDESQTQVLGFRGENLLVKWMKILNSKIKKIKRQLELLKNVKKPRINPHHLHLQIINMCIQIGVM